MMGTPGTLKKQTMQVFGIRMLQLVGGKKKKKSAKARGRSMLRGLGNRQSYNKSACERKGAVQTTSTGEVPVWRGNQGLTSGHIKFEMHPYRSRGEGCWIYGSRIWEMFVLEI